MFKKLLIGVGVLFSILFLVACKEKTYKLSLSEGITADVSNLDKVKKDSKVTLTVSVPNNYEVDTFKVNGVSEELINNTYTFTMIKDTTANVTFKEVIIEELTYYVLTLDDNITSNVTNENEVLKGSSVTVVVNVPEGMVVETFKVNGVNRELTNNIYNFNMNSNTVVTVTFTEVVVEVFYSMVLPDSIVSNQQDDNNVLSDSLVTLTVNIPENHEIDEFKINDVVVDITGNTYSFNIDNNIVVSVTFKEIVVEDNYYSLTIPSGVTTNITNYDEILEGSLVTLFIDVPLGFEIDTFKVNNVIKEVISNTYSFNIDSDTTVTVTFKALPVENTYYSLDLPKGIVANVSNLNSILEDTLVTLTITIPEGHEIDEFKVNGDLKDVIGNTYLFTINEDTVVTISFIEVWTVASQSRVNSELDNLDISLFKEGQMNVNLSMSKYYEDLNLSASFIIDEQLNITEAYIVIDRYFSDLLLESSIIFSNGITYYELEVTYNALGEVIDTDLNIGIRDFSNQGLEVFGGIFGGNPIMPTGPLSANDFLNELFIKRGNKLKTKEAFDEVEFYENGNLFKTSIKAGNIDIFNIFEGIFIDDYNTLLDLIIKDNMLKEVRYTLNDLVTLNINYENINYVVDERIIIDEEFMNYLTYYYHVDENTIIEIKADYELANIIAPISDLELTKLLRIYKKGYSVAGLYKDSEFTEPITPLDFGFVELDIYIKWEPLEDFDDLIDSYVNNDILKLDGFEEDVFYFENDEYMYLEYDGLVYIYEKDTDSFYEVSFNVEPFKTIKLIETPEGNSLLSILKELTSNDVVEMKGFYISLDYDLMFLDDMIIIDENPFMLAINGLYSNSDRPFDVSIIDTYINEAEEISVLNLEFFTFDLFIDLDTFLDTYMIQVFFSNGDIEIVTLGELAEEDLVTYEIIGKQVVIENNSMVHYGPHHTFYNSSRGTLFIVDDEHLVYLEEISDLPKYDEGEYSTFSHLLTRNHDEIHTYGELVDYINSEIDIVSLSSVYKLIDPMLLAEQLKLKEMIVIDNIFETYNYSNGTYQIINMESESMFVNFNDKTLDISTKDAFVEIDKEHLNIDNFYYGIMYYMFDDYVINYYQMIHLVTLFESFMNKDFTYETYDEGYLINDNLYIYSDDNKLYISVGGSINELSFYNTAVTAYRFDDQTTKFIFINDYIEPIKLYVNDVSNIHYYNYEHLGYFLREYYHMLDEETPLLDEPFYFDGLYDEVNYIYEDLFKILTPTELFEPMLNNDMFILSGDIYKMKVDKNSHIEIYDSTTDELEFYIDLITNQLYYYDEGDLYEFFDEGLVFNIVGFLNQYEEEWLIFDNISRYYLNSGYYDDHVVFQIDIINEGYEFKSRLLDADYYEVIIDDFVHIDISSMNKHDEYITSIDVLSYGGKVVSVNDLMVLHFVISYSDKHLTIYSYDELLNLGVIHYNDHLIDLYFMGSFSIDLEAYGISIYDESIDKVIIYIDIDEFDYLGDITELRVVDDEDNFSIFIGWALYDEVITLEDLVTIYEHIDVYYLYPLYESIDMAGIYDIFENNDYVELNFQYYDEDTYTYVTKIGYYSYIDNMFSYQDDLGGRVYITFDLDTLSISSHGVSILYNYHTYNMHLLEDIYNIKNFGQWLEQMYVLWLFFTKQMSYTEDENIVFFDYFNLSILHYDNQTLILLDETFVYLNVYEEPFIPLDREDYYDTKVTLINPSSSHNISIYLTDVTLIDHIIFVYQGEYISSYYELNEQGMPNLDKPLIISPTDKDVTGAVVFN